MFGESPFVAMNSWLNMMKICASSGVVQYHGEEETFEGRLMKEVPSEKNFFYLMR